MADIKTNHYLSLAYELSVRQEDEEVIVEECTKERPFLFVTGLGFTFDTFEAQFVNKQAGDHFDFVLPKDETNGERNEEFVFDVDKSIFMVDGKFQDEEIYPGNIVPMMDAEGNRIQAMVVEIKDDKVTLDLNHPLAGKDLHFEGTVLEKREATADEVQAMLNVITGGSHCGGCNGHCGDCEGCGDEQDSREGCHKGKGGCHKGKGNCHH